MSPKTKNGLFIILFGALLISAGLFFFHRSSEPSALKPSEVDFAQSNHPEQNAKPAPLDFVKTERPAMNLAPPSGLSAAESKQWTVFQEVINSRDDNDPRIDQELRTLSPQMHEALRKKYSEIPNENRNSRGFIAFLIARDLQSVEDARFLSSIYQEPPCLSMSDCSRPEASDPHTESTTQTSLNYPQLASLYQVEQRLDRDSSILENPDIRQEISNLLREARQFPGAALQKRAEDLQKKYGL